MLNESIFHLGWLCGFVTGMGLGAFFMGMLVLLKGK